MDKRGGWTLGEKRISAGKFGKRPTAFRGTSKAAIKSGGERGENGVQESLEGQGTGTSWGGTGVKKALKVDFIQKGAQGREAILSGGGKMGCKRARGESDKRGGRAEAKTGRSDTGGERRQGRSRRDEAYRD